MKIKNLRHKCNMTQETLASRLGVTQASVAMWETGKALPRAEMLVKLAAVLQCTVDELLNAENK